jgi:hypothetical protein
MPRIVSYDEFSLVDMPEREDALRLAAIMGDPSALDRGPQAFYLDHLKADARVEPHFHVVDQFQIFVRGGGHIGKHPVEPVTVHYVDGYTPYGPIVAGGDGIAYFNLRPRADLGVHRMPAERENLHRRAGRHRTAHCEPVVAAESGAAVRTVLIEPEPDGLCAFDDVAGPGHALPDGVAGGAGRYELVVAGTLEVDRSSLPTGSVVWAQAGERLPNRHAGSEGVRVLTLQAPVA